MFILLFNENFLSLTVLNNDVEAVLSIVYANTLKVEVSSYTILLNCDAVNTTFGNVFIVG